MKTATRKAAIAVALLVAMNGCTMSTPPPAELGNRLRVRIASRGDVPSITTAGYWLLLVLRDPEGRLVSFGDYCPKWSDSESCIGSLGVKAHSLLDLPGSEAAESRHGDRELCHDVILPQGYTLSFAPGHHYAYRDGTGDRAWVADAAPEVRIGQITADGSRYVELTASDGPPLAGDQLPPNWPPAGVR